MATIAELVEELTPKQQNLLVRLKEARTMRRASHDSYCRLIADCSEQGISFGIMAHAVSDVSKEALWRQLRRWRSAKDGT